MEDVEKFEIKVKAFIVFILFSFIAFIFLLFIGIAKVEAQETGWVFYNGQQQGSRFIFENADDVAQWTNINANVIRYDNDNITMTSGNTYTFSIRFSILLQDDINTITTIQAQPSYVRNGGLNYFKDTTCNVSYQSKILSTTSTKKTAEHYISVSCPDIKFSTGNNTIAVRFAVSNNNQYYNIIEMSRSNLIYKNNSSLTESDKIIISQNQNTNDIIDNQNQNANDIMNNQDENTDKIVDSLEGEDLTSSEKEPVNKDELNSYENAEDKLLNEDNLNYINDIDISQDSNTNDFIWDFITSAINTHTRIFGFVVTILSIGIIKLALNR